MRRVLLLVVAVVSAAERIIVTPNIRSQTQYNSIPDVLVKREEFSKLQNQFTRISKNFQGINAKYVRLRLENDQTIKSKIDEINSHLDIMMQKVKEETLNEVENKLREQECLTRIFPEKILN